MAYFKALGQTISKLGGPFLFQECQVSFTSVKISVNDWMKFLKHYLKLYISKPSYVLQNHLRFFKIIKKKYWK